MSNKLTELTVRSAARKRMPIDGADAQALEHAITITENERDILLARVTELEASVDRESQMVDRLNDNLIDLNLYIDQLRKAGNDMADDLPGTNESVERWHEACGVTKEKER